MAVSNHHTVFAKYDDLRCIGTDVPAGNGITLVSLVHDEMYFLPVFLQHYRALGVTRFVLLDDRSTDGSTAFLKAQPDVVLLQSDRTYGEDMDADDAQQLGEQRIRGNTIWRQLMLDKYCTDEWAICVDLDEFIDLPDGLDFGTVTEGLDRSGIAAVWSLMLDMYPADIGALRRMTAGSTLDLNEPWYFDGEPHLVLRAGQGPAYRHMGARARLVYKYGLNHRYSASQMRLRKLLMRPAPYFNAIEKPVLFRWHSQARMISSHRVSMPCSPNHLLPMRHFKFAGEVFGRIAWASAKKEYAGGSKFYAQMEGLLARMAKKGAPFTYRKSVELKGYDDLRRTGNALGFDDL